MSQIRLNRVDDLIQRCCEDRMIAGAVAMVVHRNQVLHRSAMGMMDMEAGRAMQPDAIFRIASMTKPITAVAVLMLHDEGHFQLDDSISDFIPEFAQGQVFVGDDAQGLQRVERERDITIRHLLMHTSGMCLGIGDEPPVEALWSDAVAGLMQTPGTTLLPAVRALARLPLASQPGSAWRYSLSFEALAALVEVVSGEWFDQFLKRRIFEPLGMVDSGYVIQPENAERLSALYAGSEARGLSLIEAPSDSPHVLLHAYESGTGWTTGGDMLVSTAADYARLLQMLLKDGELDGARLLKPATVAQMRTNQLSDSILQTAEIMPGYGQGLAVQVLVDPALAGDIGTAGEFAGAGGHGTYFWVDPKEDLIGLLMLQLNPVPVQLHQQFRTSTYRALGV